MSGRPWARPHELAFDALASASCSGSRSLRQRLHLDCRQFRSFRPTANHYAPNVHLPALQGRRALQRNSRELPLAIAAQDDDLDERIVATQHELAVQLDDLSRI